MNGFSFFCDGRSGRRAAGGQRVCGTSGTGGREVACRLSAFEVENGVGTTRRVQGVARDDAETHPCVESRGLRVLFVHIRAFQIIIFFQDSGCPDSFRNIYRSGNDSLVFICSFDGLSVSCIHHNMMDITIFCRENQIPRLCVFNRNLGSILALIFGYSWQIIAKSLINLLYKSGAVRPFCQACTAPYIRIANKLACVINNGLSCRVI